MAAAPSGLTGILICFEHLLCDKRASLLNRPHQMLECFQQQHTCFNAEWCWLEYFPAYDTAGNGAKHFWMLMLESCFVCAGAPGFGQQLGRHWGCGPDAGLELDQANTVHESYFSDPDSKHIYKQRASAVVGRVNVYNGRRYVVPTCFAGEAPPVHHV